MHAIGAKPAVAAVLTECICLSSYSVLRGMSSVVISRALEHVKYSRSADVKRSRVLRTRVRVHRISA